MPMKIEELDGAIGVVISGSGVVTDDEYLAELSAHLTNLKSSYRYSISDYSDVTDVRVSAEAIRQIALMCQRASKDYPDAILALVGERAIIYGLQRMWAAYVDGIDWEIGQFRSRSEAEQWIKDRAAERWGLDPGFERDR